MVQIQVTFDIGTDVDQAALNVNNRVKQAEPRLPLEVRRQGVTVEKGSSAFLQVLAFYSPDGRFNDIYHLELRDAERARPPQARAGHHQRADLRRQGLRHAHLGEARPPDAAPRHHLRPDRARSTSRTRSSPPARSASRRRRRAQELVYTITTNGRLADPARVREDHRARQRRRLGAAPEGRRARRARGARLRVHRPHQRQAGHAGRHLPAARRQRARGGGGGEAAPWRRLAQRFPAGPRLLDPLRHHALRRGLDQGGGGNAADRHGAGVPRRLPLPAELARDAHPLRRGAGVAHRQLRRPVSPGLLDQHADAVRHGARHRHRGRRRHRGAGERRAHHARGGARAARGGDQGDARGDQPDHRHRAGAVRGVRADRVHRRPCRRALPPVRGDHLDRGGDLRDRRAHAYAVAVRHRPETGKKKRTGPVRLVQPRLLARHRPLRVGRGLDHPARRGRARALRHHGRRRVLPLARDPGEPRARRGPGLLHRRRGASGRSDARAHRQGGGRGGEGDPVQPEQPRRGGLQRLRSPRRRLPQQRRHHLCDPEALGRARGGHRRSSSRTSP